MDVTGITSSGAVYPNNETKAAAASDSDFSAVLNAASGSAAQGQEVQYLDGATGQTKTGYVIGDALYEDAGGTIPASDYSEFRKTDGMLYIRTPYGTIRKSEFNVMLQKQQQYDVQTYGQPIYGENGVHTGTMTPSGKVEEPLTSYTSAPNGPGTVSEEIWNQYSVELAGTGQEIPIEAVLPTATEETGIIATEETASGTTAPVLSVGTDTAASGAASATPAGAEAGADGGAGNTSAGPQSEAVETLLDADRNAQIAARTAASRRALLQQYIDTMLLGGDS